MAVVQFFWNVLETLVLDHTLHYMHTKPHPFKLFVLFLGFSVASLCYSLVLFVLTDLFYSIVSTILLYRPDGLKKAYVRLAPDYDALDVANKVCKQIMCWGIQKCHPKLYTFLLAIVE